MSGCCGDDTPIGQQYCNACRIKKAVIIADSSIQGMRFAYCPECLSRGCEPREFLNLVDQDMVIFDGQHYVKTKGTQNGLHVPNN